MCEKRVLSLADFITKDSELMLYVLNYALFFTELCFKMLYFWQGCFILKVM